ncbi:NTP transferase domain-containing protein [Paracoccus sp. R86501]|uniref:nucleotidyltransferase family protein n=1 Tax=Paracoccus sp. R86501 TaxID=3101711 RepID=UPI00366D783E
MIRTGLLLAAGASRRFGPEDKLLAGYRGRPLVSYAADAMRAADLDDRVAVVTNDAVAAHLQGFRIIRIEQGQQSDSLRAGLAAVGDPDRLLIALADMPLVTTAHLDAVLKLARDDAIAASHDGSTALPPACFPRSKLPALATLKGDQGAGRLLRDLPQDAFVHAPDLLIDIDTRHDLTN